MNSLQSLTRRDFVIGTLGVAVFAVSPALRQARLAGATVDIYVVTAAGLRLRSGPGLGYSVLASLSKGTTVEVIAWSGSADGYDWANVWVSSPNKTGFVATAFLARKDTSGGSGTFPIGSTVHVDTATGTGANMRSAPSITASVVRVIPNGTIGKVESGETPADGYRWVNVTMSGSSGWMATIVLSAGTGSGTQPPPSGGSFAIGSTVHVDTGGSRANMRSGPSITASVIATFANGTTGTVQSGETAADGYRWITVAIGGTSGWMATSVLAAGAGTTTPPPANDTTETFAIGATVHLDTSTGGNANLRSGPGLSYAVIKIVPNGTTATVLSAKSMADGLAWVKIEVLDVEGWMANGCLSAGAGTE